MEPEELMEETEELTASEPEVEEAVVSEVVEDKRYVCDACFSKNLTHSVNVKRCMQCNEIHCMHFVSKIDPQYCIHCMHDVTVTFETVQKTQTTYNEQTDTLHTRTRKAKQIRITGLHWMFAQRKIDEYNDAELDLAIEYHLNTYHALIHEREQRKIDYIQKRYKNTPSVLNIPGINGPSVTETTTVKKSRTIKASKTDDASANLAAALQLLMKAGLSADQIAAKVLKK